MELDTLAAKIVRSLEYVKAPENINERAAVLHSIGVYKVGCALEDIAETYRTGSEKALDIAQQAIDKAGEL